MNKDVHMCPHILLQISEARQDELIKKIKCLNGVYVQSKVMIATHFVCDELTCSELFLHACVRGLWILSSKYIDDSYEKGSWLKEDNYEYCQSDSSLNPELISAANRWHWKFLIDHEQPFTDWNVALDLKLANCDFYHRILKHGGANVKTFDSSLQPRDFQNVTYLFLDSTNSELTDDLLDYGLLCLNSKFIIDTVIKEEILNPFDYVIRNSMPVCDNQDFCTDQMTASSINESQTSSCHFKTAFFSKKKSVYIKIVSQNKQPNIEEIVATSFLTKKQDKRPSDDPIDQVTKQQKKHHINKLTDYKNKKQVNVNCALNEVSNTVLHTKPAVVKKDRNLFDSLSPSISIHELEPPNSRQCGNKSSSASNSGQMSLFDFGYFTEALKHNLENAFIGEKRKVLPAVESSLKSIDDDVIVISDDVIVISDDDNPVGTGNLVSEKSTSLNSSLFVSKMERKCDNSLITCDHFFKNTVTNNKANCELITNTVNKVTNSSICTKNHQLKKKAFIPTKSFCTSQKSQRKKTNSNHQAVVNISIDDSTYQHLADWPFSFPIHLTPTPSTNMKQVPNLYAEWMASAREMDFPDIALTYATPSLEKSPAPLLIRQLKYLLQAPDTKDSSKANCYIQSWLRMHPPNTTSMIKCYNSLNATDETSFLEMIEVNLNQQNYFCAAWILEFCVSLFEINWNHCLKQSTKKSIQKSIIVIWLWHSPYVVQYDATSKKVLKIVKIILLLPAFKFHLCQAVFSLVALVAECIRLANVKWDSANHFFMSDSIVALAYDLSELLCSCTDNFETLLTTIHLVKPDWLKTLVVVKILSRKYNYLLIQPFQLNHLSWTSIVHQFFYLIKEIKTNAMLESTDVKHENLFCNKANKRDSKGETPVHVACRKNNVEKLQELLSIPGVDINLKDNAGWTPLHEACCHGSFECLVLLLNYTPSTPGSSKFDINAFGPDGMTPLMDAVIHNHEGICRELLKHGGKALLLTKSEYGYKALDFAKTENMKTLLNESDKDDSNKPETETLITEKKSVYLSCKECKEYLLLLSVLLSSHYSYTLSLNECCPNTSHHSDEDSNVLLNILSHFYDFKKDLQSLTKPKDHKLLEDLFLCLELLCETIKDIA